MIHVALKEWKVVCDLLAAGELALLLRKGGIHEDAGAGCFRLEHERFALFPSWLHQKSAMMKAAYRGRVEARAEPAEVTLETMGEAARVWAVPSRAAFDALEDLHCWSGEQIDMRFDYKPQKPLYLIAVRASRLATPKTVVNHWSYGGCKSWAPLREGDAVDDAGATPALSDGQFEAIVRRVDEAVAEHAAPKAGGG